VCAHRAKYGLTYIERDTEQATGNTSLFVAFLLAQKRLKNQQEVREMRRLFFAAFLLFLMTVEAVAGIKDTQLTIYSQNLALVKQTREFVLKKGENKLSFTGISPQFDPTSVVIRSLAAPEKLTVLEQYYQYDLVSSAKILERYLGKQVQVYSKGGWFCQGKLLSFSTEDLVLETKEGELRIIRTAQITRIQLARMPAGLVTRPTLKTLLACPEAGRHQIELVYLTQGLNWHAEYQAVEDKDGNSMEFSCQVSIDNRSGVSYQNARLRLVAGQIHRAGREYHPSPMARTMALEKALPQFTEESLFEYHIYTLDRQTTIENNQSKQMPLFSNISTRVNKIYSYDATEDEKHVKVRLKFKNIKRQGLGMPLPAGKVRIFKKEADGGIELVGEDRITHTPIGEEVKLTVGNAFDLVAERSLLEHRRISRTVSEEKIQIRLRNRKEEAVTVLVTEHLSGDWEILESSHDYSKKDAYTVEFKIPVEKGKESTVEYKVRYH